MIERFEKPKRRGRPTQGIHQVMEDYDLAITYVTVPDAAVKYFRGIESRMVVQRAGSDLKALTVMPSTMTFDWYMGDLKSWLCEGMTTTPPAGHTHMLLIVPRCQRGFMEDLAAKL